MKIISLPENVRLPDGYHFGAHWSSPGQSGYYLIRDEDDAAIRAELRPDLEQVDDEDAAEDDGYAVTADEVLEKIEAGFNGDG